MGYSTVKEVTGMVKEDMQNAIIGDEFIEDSKKRNKLFAGLAEAAIEDADAEINGYLAKRYPIPLPKVPKILNKFSKDIAVYNLISRMGIDESEREKTYQNRYYSAIKFLENVAKGITDIGVTGNKESAAIGFSMDSSRRLFSRDSMKGW